MVQILRKTSGLRHTACNTVVLGVPFFNVNMFSSTFYCQLSNEGMNSNILKNRSGTKSTFDHFMSADSFTPEMFVRDLQKQYVVGRESKLKGPHNNDPEQLKALDY